MRTERSSRAARRSSPHNVVDQSEWSHSSGADGASLVACLARRAQEVIVARLRLPEGKLQLSATLSDLEADSLASVDILIALADEFEVDIPYESIEKAMTVRQIIQIFVYAAVVDSVNR